MLRVLPLFLLCAAATAAEAELANGSEAVVEGFGDRPSPPVANVLTAR